MRNIARVVLWGLPPSFCAFVERAGRAGRDFKALGEAILIVPSSIYKAGTSEEELESELRSSTGTEEHTEAENRGEDIEDVLINAGIEVTGSEGIRISADHGEESDDEDGLNERKKTLKEANTHEARFLSMYVCTKHCRRKVWNRFFKNNEKRELQHVHQIFKLTHLVPSPTFISDNHVVPKTSRHALLR